MNVLRYVLAFFVPFGIVIVATPFAGRMAVRFGIVDMPAENKFHSKATPYLGGAAVGAAFLFAAIVISEPSLKVLTILLSAAAVFAVGLFDDRRTVGPGVKLVVEVAAAIALWSTGLRVQLFDVYALDLLLTVVWIVAITNAFNLLDNMDGLTAGAAGISALTFFVLAMHDRDYVMASLSLALAGACLGFLRYNFPPAKIFLGDTGALLIGFLLGAFALADGFMGQNGFVWMLIPVLALAVPLLDMIFVIASRIRSHRPIYIGGTDHSSHRFAAMGLSLAVTALLFYAVQAALSLAAVAVVVSETTVAVALAPVGVIAVVGSLWFFVVSPVRERVAVAAEVIDLDVIELDAISPNVIQVDAIQLGTSAQQRGA